MTTRGSMIGRETGLTVIGEAMWIDVSTLKKSTMTGETLRGTEVVIIMQGGLSIGRGGVGLGHQRRGRSR